MIPSSSGHLKIYSVFHQFIVQNKYQNAPKKQTDFLHAVNWLFKIDYVSYSRRSDKARRVISGVQLKSRA